MTKENDSFFSPNQQENVFTKNLHFPAGKILTWNLGKNLKLKLERGIGFERVAEAIERNAFQLANVRSKNHPGQKCFLIRLHGKTWVVPFKENKTSIHLFTVYPEN